MKFGMFTMALTVVSVSAAVLSPEFLLVVPVVGVAYGLTKSWFRLLFFVVGAFLVFQTGDGLSVAKLGYLAGVMLAGAASAYALVKHADRDYLARVRSALYGAALLAFWILGPMLVQGVIINGTPLEMWARDALTYLLISTGVIIGVDASNTVTLFWARGITISVGLLAAIGFATAWIQRRGLGESISDPTEQSTLLGSMVALTLPLALCLTIGLGSKRISVPWLLLAPVFLIAVLVTGTRTGFVLTVILVGVVGLASQRRVTPGRAILGAAIGAASLSAVLPAAGAMFSSEEFVQQRIDMMISTVRDGFGSDASGLIRERATNFCVDIFADSPLLGQGLGKYFPNPNPGRYAVNFTLDSWAVYPAKFGIIGTVVLAVSLVLIWRGLALRGNGKWLHENTAVRGAALACIALLLFGAPTEDKGFAVAVALAAVLVCAGDRSSFQQPELDSSTLGTVWLGPPHKRRPSIQAAGPT
ncbi:O-antigen ligase family protein [Arthrobacter sp. ISL-48]|uniref:O-antigen ligase family protein n=1 Tax=Arthrobacter sp. ISL-48 TaxID=2819110 RepID=UPI001BECAC32|nr:O-antigen ligase family protein [Arthrobacter sp. ISL-48]MBT2534310.1 O-antigen ligase family protein [Arthrobacter sp. ISL-48]